MKVAINGFGRIGRLAFRKMCDRDDMELVAVNSRSNINMLAHLLKYDSTQGRFQKKVEIKDDKFIIDDKKEVKVFAKSDPSELPWGELGIDVVLECTGAFTDREKASIHIKSGAKKVLISSPAKKDDIKMVVYNVNHDILDGTEDIISGASCTTNCLAPMAKALNNSFGIERGLMTTIHAYTADQNTLDASHRKNDKRRARSAGINIVPNTTGAARAIGQVIPELKGKLDGASMRVPVATGSITELTSVLKKKVTVEEVNEAMKKAANESFGYNEDEIVSSDIVGMEYGSLFDATLTKIVETQEGQLVKTVAWYDNEMSYTCQLIKTLAYIGKLMKK